MLDDFNLTIQYGNQKPIEINTCHIKEDVLRMKMGLKPHKENGIYSNDFLEDLRMEQQEQM